MGRIAFLILSFLAACAAAERAPEPALTVLLDFQGSQSSTAVHAMRTEVNHLFRDAGMKLDIKLRSETEEGAEFRDVVLFRFKGNCRMSDFSPWIDERGPLAWTHTSDGEVLPFGEVACDRVRRAVESAMGGQRKDSERVLGRALGRVVAHELYHMIGKTRGHGKAGLARPGITAAGLIDERGELAPEDARLLRHR